MTDQTLDSDSGDQTMISALQSLSAEMHVRNKRFECLVRQGKIFIVLLGSLVIFILLAVSVLIPLALSNRRILNTVDSVTDPKGKFARDSQAKTAAVVASLSAENDCRARRAVVHLPAPDPGKSCASQTDVSVYPGG